MKLGTYAIAQRLMQPGDQPELDELEALFERPAWMADAACREHPNLSWFPGPGQPTDEQRAVCGGCSVREECRAYAVEGGDEDGLWGGEMLSSWVDDAPRHRRPIRARKSEPPKPFKSGLSAAQRARLQRVLG